MKNSPYLAALLLSILPLTAVDLSPVTIAAKDRQQLILNAEDLRNLDSAFLNFISNPLESEIMGIEPITELPIASIRPLQILLGQEQTISSPNDVGELIKLMDFLVLSEHKKLEVLRTMFIGHEKHFCDFYKKAKTSKDKSFFAIVDQLFEKTTSQHFYFYRYLVAEGASGSLALTQDNNTLFSGALDGTITIWHKNPATNQFDPRERLVAPNVPRPARVNTLAVTADGNTLFSGSSDRAIIVWRKNPATNQFEFTQRMVNASDSLATSLATTSDGTTLFSGLSDWTIKKWLKNPSTGLFEFNEDLTHNIPAERGHHGWVTGLAISSHDDTLLSGSSDGTIIVWYKNPTTNQFEPENRFYAFQQHPVKSVSISSLALTPDGNTLLGGSTRGTIIVWTKNPTTNQFDFEDGVPLPIHHINMVTALLVTTDGNSVFSGSDRTVIEWKAENLKQYCKRIYPSLFEQLAACLPASKCSIQ